MMIGWDDFATVGGAADASVGDRAPRADAPLADVCIVGGGAAGLTLADALRGSGLRVVLLEAGGTRQTAAAQDFFRGELADPAVHPFLHHFRVRAIGGASRIWGGRCVPFDPIDFTPRDWVAGSGWPIGPQALAPYYVAAQVAAQAGPFDYDPATALAGQPAAFAPGLDGALIATTLERFSLPTNFWTRFGQGLTRDPKVGVALAAAVTGVRLAADGGSVSHIEVRRPDGVLGRVRARAYVLAAGGLETVRLLLASDDVKACGVGGDHGQLGRNYMSHLAATAGQIAFTDPKSVNFDYTLDGGGVYLRRRLALTPQAQRDHQCLNTAFRTQLPNAADPAHGDPVLSAMFLVKDLVLYEYSRKMRAERPTVAHRLRHLANLARNPLRLAAFSRKWIGRRILAERKLPSVVLGSATGVYDLEFHAEQAPNPGSRLYLTAERDRAGMRRLGADWRTTALDLDSLRRSYAVLDGELRRTGTGRLIYDPDLVAQKALAEGAYGGHHIGAAKMSLDPRDGVVDADGQVHGVRGLYLASSAVFPTSSQANPTLTILALTLRLADLLKRDLKH